MTCSRHDENYQEGSEKVTLNSLVEELRKCHPDIVLLVHWELHFFGDLDGWHNVLKFGLSPSLKYPISRASILPYSYHISLPPPLELLSQTLKPAPLSYSFQPANLPPLHQFSTSLFFHCDPRPLRNIEGNCKPKHLIPALSPRISFCFS